MGAEILIRFPPGFGVFYIDEYTRHKSFRLPPSPPQMDFLCPRHREPHSLLSSPAGTTSHSREGGKCPSMFGPQLGIYYKQDKFR